MVVAGADGGHIVRGSFSAKEYLHVNKVVACNTIRDINHIVGPAHDSSRSRSMMNRLVCLFTCPGQLSPFTQLKTQEQ